MNNKYYINIGFISTEEEYASNECITYFFKTFGRNTFLYIEEENGIVMFNANDIDSIKVEEIKDEA